MLTEKSTAAEIHAELRAGRDAFAQKLRTALTAAGFTVTGTMPQGDWERGVLTVHSDTTKEFEIYAEFDIRSVSRWTRSDPSKVRLTYSYGGGYCRSKTRYQKLDDALVAKLVADTQEHLKKVLTGIECRNKQENDVRRWAAIRAEQLAGVVLPPGTQVKIVTGNGPGSGTYRVEFERYHNSISDTPLFAAQVKKLMALLNELQGTTNRWVIAATHDSNGRTYAFGSGGYWDEGNPRLFIAEDEANAHLEQASKSFEGGKDFRVVRYADVATI